MKGPQGARPATASREAAAREAQVAKLTYVKLASAESSRDVNCDLVFELIRIHQPLGRSELARYSGLRPSTISQIVDQLIREGWVVEGSSAKRPRGRRPVMLTLNSDLLVLAVDLRPAEAILAVINLNGHVLAREAVPLASKLEVAVRDIGHAGKLLRSAFPGKRFEGVGISVPGRVDPHTQEIVLAPNLRWGRYDIRSALAAELHLPVELENAANAALLSECWFGRLDGVRNAVLITVSEGLGAGILSGGLLVTGQDGMAGEFGHIPLDPGGPLCGCGEQGCWEMYASDSAAVREYAALTSSTAIKRSQELFRLVAEGDEQAWTAVQRQAEALGRGMRLVTVSLAPEVIIVMGAITSQWPRLGAIVEAKLAAGMLAGRPPRLVPASDGEFARLRGAAALVLFRHSGHYRSRESLSKPGEAPATRTRSRRPAKPAGGRSTFAVTEQSLA